MVGLWARPSAGTCGPRWRIPPGTFHEAQVPGLCSGLVQMRPAAWAVSSWGLPSKRMRPLSSTRTLSQKTVAFIAGVVAARGAVVTGVNNNTDFLSSVRAGVILAEATVIRAGRRTQLIAVDMIHKHTLVARSTLRTMVTPAPVEGNPGRPADKFEDAQ